MGQDYVLAEAHFKAWYLVYAGEGYELGSFIAEAELETSLGRSMTLDERYFLQAHNVLTARYELRIEIVKQELNNMEVFTMLEKDEIYELTILNYEALISDVDLVDIYNSTNVDELIGRTLEQEEIDALELLFG